MLAIVFALAAQVAPDPAAPADLPAVTPALSSDAVAEAEAVPAPAVAPTAPLDATAVPAASAAIAPAAVAPAAPDSCTLAILDLEAGDGMTKPHAVALTDVITGEVGALSGCSVLSRADVRGVLSFEAEKQLLGCSSDSSCLAELAGALGADLLVTGSVSKIGGSTLLSLRMTDLKSLKVMRRATDTFAGGDDQAIAFVAWMARKLMSDDAEKVGPKPVPVAASAAARETRGTIWGGLAWTGVVVTSVAGLVTGGLAASMLVVSDQLRALKSKTAFVERQDAEDLESVGEGLADGANLGLYVTAGLAAITLPLFLLPQEEEVSP